MLSYKFVLVKGGKGWLSSMLLNAKKEIQGVKNNITKAINMSRKKGFESGNSHQASFGLILI